MIFNEYLGMKMWIPVALLVLLMLVKASIYKLEFWCYSWQHDSLQPILFDGEDTGPFLFDSLSTSLFLFFGFLNDSLPHRWFCGVMVEFGELIAIDGSQGTAIFDLHGFLISYDYLYRVFEYSLRWKSFLLKISLMVMYRDPENTPLKFR